jgi:hypothetical protein
MTPKEKALYLLNLSTLTNFEEAKKIALMIVNEILNEFPNGFNNNFEMKRKLYWQEVKQETEKL